MSVLEAIIRRLRTSTTRFEDRVAGLAELAWLRSEQNLITPSAFVLPDDEKASNQSQIGGITRQLDITSNYTVAVWLDANDDPRNQNTAVQLDDIRDELLGALLTWRPTEMHTSFTYEGMKVGGQDQDRSVYMYSFSTTVTINTNCYKPEVGLTPAAQFAKAADTWIVEPDVTVINECGEPTGDMLHSRGIGLTINSDPCDPCLESEPVFSANVEDHNHGNHDACEGQSA